MHYESVHLTLHIPKSGEGNIKVVAEAGWGSSAVKIGTFYLPYSQKMPDAKIYAARMKHDFKVTFDHYSATYVGV